MKSTGTSGSMRLASPPSRTIASRMAAMSPKSGLPQQVFEHYLERERQSRHARQPELLGGGQAVINVTLARDLKLTDCLAAIERHHIKTLELHAGGAFAASSGPALPPATSANVARAMNERRQCT